MFFSLRTKYAIRKLGIDIRLVLERDLDTFEGTSEEKQIKYDFYNETKDELIKQVICPLKTKLFFSTMSSGHDHARKR